MTSKFPKEFPSLSRSIESNILSTLLARLTTKIGKGERGLDLLRDTNGLNNNDVIEMMGSRMAPLGLVMWRCWQVYRQQLFGLL